MAVDREFARKTARLVQERTETGPIKPSLEVYEIDDGTLSKIKESKASDTKKVFNLLKSILEAHPHWARSERHERSVKQALCRNLVKAGLSGAAKLVDLCRKVMAGELGDD